MERKPTDPDVLKDRIELMEELREKSLSGYFNRETEAHRWLYDQKEKRNIPYEESERIYMLHLAEQIDAEKGKNTDET